MKGGIETNEHFVAFGINAAFVNALTFPTKGMPTFSKARSLNSLTIRSREDESAKSPSWGFMHPLAIKLSTRMVVRIDKLLIIPCTS